MSENRQKRYGGGLGMLLLGLCFVIILLVVVLVLVNTLGGRCECDCEEAGEGEYEIVVEDEAEEGEISVKDYIAEVDAAINKTDDAEEKAELYISRAIKLWYVDPSANNGQMEKIVSDLKKAEELDPSMESAWWLYYIEEARGNQELAKQYLSLAEERGYEPGNGAG